MVQIRHSIVTGLWRNKYVNTTKSACDAGAPGSIPGLGRSHEEGRGCPLQLSWASLVAQAVKNPPAMREAWVWSLGWEDGLEKEKLPSPVFLPGEFHGQRIQAGSSPWGCKKSDRTEWLSLSLSLPIGPISNAVRVGGGGAVRASTDIFGGKHSSVRTTFLLDKLKTLDMILFVSYMLFVLKSTFFWITIYSHTLSYA